MEALISGVLGEQCLLSRDDGFVIGVSGGIDSLTLLDLLHRSGWRLSAGHYNHGIRENADADEAFVREFCEQRGIQLEVGRGDVLEFATVEKRSIEEAARELRYKFLFDLADLEGASAVVVAHTADDQVETILMNLIRGAGLAGLSGMRHRSMTAWHSTIPLARPLLGIRRADLEAYCQERGLDSREDESNLNLRFQRNRVRHELTPFLAAFDERIAGNLLRMAEVLAGEEAVLEELTEDCWNVVCILRDQDEVAFVREGFLKFSLGLQRRLLRKALGFFFPGLVDVNFRMVEEIRAAILDPPQSRQLELSKGIRLSIQDSRVILFQGDNYPLDPGQPQMGKEATLLAFPGSTRLDGGWEVVADLFPLDVLNLGEIEKNPNSFVAYLDAENCAAELYARPRRPGDLFHPLGMMGSMKVSDFMVNVKMPKQVREFWPLVFAGDELVWIPGYRLSQSARIKPQTTMVLRLGLVQDVEI